MTVALILQPQDLLFARDGRPIVAGEGAAAGSALPSPQVVAGAIRSAVLKARNQLPASGGPVAPEHLQQVLQIRVRGPLIWDHATRNAEGQVTGLKPVAEGKPLLPCPADCVAPEKPKHGAAHGVEIARLRPLAEKHILPGWAPPANQPHLRPLWSDKPVALKGKPDDSVRARAWHAQPGYLTWSGFETWAKGGDPLVNDFRQTDDLWTTEVRTQVGLGVDTATAEDGRLFSTRYLRLRTGIALYIEVDGADAEFAKGGSLLLAGDRRLAQATVVKPIAFPKPTGPHLAAVAITPTLVAEPSQVMPADWLTLVRGTAIPGSDPVSGWDLAANGGAGAPRPTRFAIRPGAVWHLAGLSAPTTAIGRETESGFGWLAWGAWRPALS